MANTCPCGRRDVAEKAFRSIMDTLDPEGFWIEWDKECPNGCGDKPTVTLTNRETGETRVFSFNQVWVLFGGLPDQVGLMTINLTD